MYPKDPRENLRYRATLLEECETSLEVANMVREKFRRDVLFAFNTFFWAYDPTKKHKERPIVTYPFQDESILEINRWIESGENGIADKSRDMLATYMVLGVFLWRFLTKRGEEFKVGSRKEEFVDKRGDMDTLFEKLRFNIDRLPWYVLPQGWNKDRHATYMRLVNPELESAIIGEATNRDFGRGGRKKAFFYDEFSAWEMAEEAWRSGSDATKCKIAVWTPKGSGNKAAELARTEEVKNKLHLIWWKHPEKAVTSPKYIERLKKGIRVKGVSVELHQDQSQAPKGCYIDTTGKIRSEWYDGECEKRDLTDIRENLDCDYVTSGNPVFDTAQCSLNQRNSKPPIVRGELMWRVRPLFDEHGNCINKNQLDVEFVPNGNGLLSIWEHPELTHEDGYSISADVAEGLEQGDYNSASVLKRFGELKVVASLHGHLKTFEYAEELAKLGVYYGHVYIAVERNNTMGGSVIEQLFRVYPKLFFREVLSKGYPEITDRIGWETNKGTKGAMIGNLSKAISERSFLDPDEMFWKETITYVNNDGTLEAQGKSRGERCYDDRVMDRAIGLMVHQMLPLPKPKRKVQAYQGWRREWDRRPKGDLVTFA